MSIRLDDMDSSLLELSLTNDPIHKDVYDKYYHHANDSDSSTKSSDQQKSPLRKTPSVSERLNILHLSRSNTHKVIPVNSLDSYEEDAIDTPGMIKPSMVVPAELEEKLHVLQRRNITNPSPGNSFDHTINLSIGRSFDMQDNRSLSGLSSGSADKTSSSQGLTMHHPIAFATITPKAQHKLKPKPTITLIHKLQKLSKESRHESIVSEEQHVHDTNIVDDG